MVCTLVAFNEFLQNHALVSATLLLLLSPIITLSEAARIEDLVILDDLLRNGYDRRATPTNHLNKSVPTLVYCELFVRSFTTPNPTSMDYEVDLYIRQKWKDERLKHKDLREPLDLNDPNLVKAIWKPEVYFPNAKEADFQFVTVPNVLVRIHPTGEILYMLRLKVTFSCMMDLSKFPLDSQIVLMEVASFSKTLDELILEWSIENPVTTSTLGMSQFEIVEIHAKKCYDSQIGHIGNYSCLVAEFHLSRSLGYHLIQSYLPTILMVFISWVSFWMDVNSVPGRVTLGITTLLTVSSKSTSSQENLPHTSYVKAIDVWMGTCTAFVFLALLEFTVVNFLWRKEYYLDMLRKQNNSYLLKKESEETKDNPSENEKMNPTSPHTENFVFSQNISATSKAHLDEGETPEGAGLQNHVSPASARKLSYSNVTGAEMPTIFHTEASGLGLASCNQRKHSGPGSLLEEDGNISSSNFLLPARFIDETSRYVFPITFAIFNLIYWPYYIYSK